MVGFWLKQLSSLLISKPDFENLQVKISQRKRGTLFRIKNAFKKPTNLKNLALNVIKKEQLFTVPRLKFQMFNGVLMKHLGINRGYSRGID